MVSIDCIPPALAGSTGQQFRRAWPARRRIRPMSEFTSGAAHYERFMGRYTVPLARALADEARVKRGMRVLDVGCGPGGLTSELADRVGAESVAAIDPAEQFVA